MNVDEFKEKLVPAIDGMLVDRPEDGFPILSPQPEAVRKKLERAPMKHYYTVHIPHDPEFDAVTKTVDVIFDAEGFVLESVEATETSTERLYTNGAEDHNIYVENVRSNDYIFNHVRKILD